MPRRSRLQGATVATDKLFYWIFQDRPDRILQLLDDLPATAGGYSFSAPVLKEREYRLDGLFLPPLDRPELPALILEAQMASDPLFYRRLYAETARLLQQQATIRHWQVLVICPSRQLNFGDPEPVAEFLERRVRWVELLATEQALQAPWPWLQRLLALLVLPERQLRPAIADLRQGALGRAEEMEILQLIPAIVLPRLSGLSLAEIVAMTGITLEDFSQSRAYRELIGWAEERGIALGEARGEARGETKVTLRLLTRRCGSLSAATTARIQALPVDKLEALAEALLDFTGPQDLQDWLAAKR
jgi:predicted transposase YdaD